MRTRFRGRQFVPRDDRQVMQCADAESILGKCAHCSNATTYSKCTFTQQQCNAGKGSSIEKYVNSELTYTIRLMPILDWHL